jgi:hypothetical protein
MTIKTVLLGAVVGVSTIVGMAGSASAYIACNREGDCWHTEQRYSRPGVRFDYHPDDYYFHQRWDDRRHWRGDYHAGRGYYRNGIWLSF